MEKVKFDESVPAIAQSTRDVDDAHNVKTPKIVKHNHAPWIMFSKPFSNAIFHKSDRFGISNAVIEIGGVQAVSETLGGRIS